MAVQAKPTTASLPDTLRLLTQVILPTYAKGPIIRRPGVVGFVERFDLDAKAVRQMQSMREKYGPGPLKMAVPFISRAMVMEPGHVSDLLERTPEPFGTSTVEKNAALSHFQPRGSLVSSGDERAVRRDLNERALQADRPVHDHGQRFIDVINEEARILLEQADRKGGELSWDPFFDAWFRVVRRVVFGDHMRDDKELTDLVFQLRRHGNWAFFKPKNTKLRDEMHRLLEGAIANAAPDSLAGLMKDMPADGENAPPDQVLQWLFAIDPAGMSVFRSLALLATHPQAMERARQEIRDDETGRQRMPFLRSTVLESQRLWPTTPFLLRQSTTKTAWGDTTLPDKTGLIIFTPYFHRDSDRLEFADRFAPEIWQDGRTTSHLSLVPFSAGPGICPGRWVVLLLTGAFIAALIDGRNVEVTSHHRKTMTPNAPLPGTMDNYTLRFQVSPQA
jgi:cytochrome P450